MTQQMIQKDDMFELILKDSVILIPSSFRSISDVNNDIFAILTKDKKYYVKSNVSKDTFQIFLNHWIHKEIPRITINNYLELFQLSQEFNRMQDIVKLYKNFISNSTIFSLLQQKQDLTKRMNQKKQDLASSETNYKQIIDHLFKNDGIDSHSKFQGIKNELLNKCFHNDVECVDFLTRKQVKENGLLFVINETEKTAFVFQNLTAEGDIVIPRSIIYNSHEFIVTRICSKSFLNDHKIMSIHFQENSELKFIDDYAFSFSSLKKIKIPSHVIEIGVSCFSDCIKLESVDFSIDSKLKTIKKFTFENSSIYKLTLPSNVEKLEYDWCSGVSKLNNISISLNNKYLKNYKEFLIGKSEEKSEEFDVIFFAPRNIKKIKIPSFVKQIAPHSFDKCLELTFIEFEEKSQLRLIGSSSFSSSSIKSILIPSSVVHIDNFAFSNCHNLEKVEFEKDSKLYSIGEFAFSDNKSLKYISLPNNLKQIGECAFSGCSQLKTINFSEKSELKIIGKSVFSSSSIENLSIPSCVEEIDDEWGREISFLINIKIFPSKNSNLVYYDNSFILGKSNTKSDNYDVLLFARRNVKHVKIPSFITMIASYAFSNCKDIESFEFSANSELKIIGEYSFSNSSIKTIIFPPKLEKIEKYTFCSCDKLESIEFTKNSQLKTICEYSFINCTIEKISIPSSFIEFKTGWCHGIFNINFHINVFQCNEQNICCYGNYFILGKTDRKSDIFDELLFSCRSIRNVKIPSFIRIISPYAFSQCKLINRIKFKNNSHVTEIEKYSFSFSSIEKISIPKTVEKIMECAFYYCNNLQKVEISNDSQLKSIEKSAFSCSLLSSLFIPSNVSNIGKAAFTSCKNLQIIEISEYSKIKIISKNLFQNSKFDIIIMVPIELENQLIFIDQN